MTDEKINDQRDAWLKARMANYQRQREMNKALAEENEANIKLTAEQPPTAPDVVPEVAVPPPDEVLFDHENRLRVLEGQEPLPRPAGFADG